MKIRKTLCLCRVLSDSDMGKYHIIVEVPKEKREIRFSIPMDFIGREEIDLSMICKELVEKCIRFYSGYRSEQMARVLFDPYRMDVLNGAEQMFPFGDMYGFLKMVCDCEVEDR
jgi:hypothetical protein